MTNKKRTRRRYWTVAQKRQYVSQFKQGGQSAMTYCREHDLHYTTFLRWRSEQAEGPMRLEPMTVTPSASSSAALMIEVETPSGYTVRVHAGCDRQLLREVWACCCD